MLRGAARLFQGFLKLRVQLVKGTYLKQEKNKQVVVSLGESFPFLWVDFLGQETWQLWGQQFFFLRQRYGASPHLQVPPLLALPLGGPACQPCGYTWSAACWTGLCCCLLCLQHLHSQHPAAFLLVTALVTLPRFSEQLRLSSLGKWHNKYVTAT